jgi:uncharacterized protein YbaP (TraB family)
MVWRLEKGGKTSFLVGTAHFFCYPFTKPLTRLIGKAENILFEGPLDEESMAQVAACGRQGEGSPSLLEALDPSIVKKINRQLNKKLVHHDSVQPDLGLFDRTPSDFLDVHARGARPWMAFFTLWSSYLEWNYSVDMEAFQIARRLGKKIHFLETIEEQIAVLDGIPFELIVDYINRFERWKSYRRQLLESYLSGDLERIMSRRIRFPTRCDSVLGERDVKLFDGLKKFFNQGDAVAFLGLSHIPAIKERLTEEGYLVTQTTA